MANRNTNKRRAATRTLKAQGWGIINAQGQLLTVALDRDSIRLAKRVDYSGAEYRTVKINAVLTPYTK